MESFYPFIAVLNFASAVQGLFLAYLLFNRKTHRKESQVLGALMVVMSVAILGAVLGISGYYRIYPHFVRVGDPLVLLFGPLLFFYIELLTRGRLPGFYQLHLIPFAVYLISLIPFYALSGEEKIAFVDRFFLSEGQNLTAIGIQITRRTHLLVYVILCLVRLTRYETMIRDHFSNLEKISLGRSRFILNLFVVLSAVGAVLFGLSFWIPMNFVLLNNLSSLFIGLVIYALAWVTWNHPPLPNAGPPAVTSEGHPAAEHYGKEPIRARLTLSDRQFSDLSVRIETLLNRDKLFFDPELNLEGLSEKLNSQPYQTSELISRLYRESFFDLINRHRVEEVKKRLIAPEFSAYSILGIAMDCGFSSKSAFNSAFRKFAGCTPSEFREKNKSGFANQDVPVS